MRQHAVLVALSAITLASAHESSQNFTIDPNSIDYARRNAWCGAQYDSCRTLCAGSPTKNDCKSETLEYSCLCSNGSAPGLEYYTQTIPTFICMQAFEDCIAANTDSSRAQDECKANILSQCATRSPDKADFGDSQGESTSSATQTPTASPSQSSAASTSSSTAGAAPTNIGYVGNGVAMLAAGVFAALL
ncbi:hypothetical protein VTH06DRAFT_8096 [Thermothelomyces fergusii]